MKSKLSHFTNSKTEPRANATWQQHDEIQQIPKLHAIAFGKGLQFFNHTVYCNARQVAWNASDLQLTAWLAIVSAVVPTWATLRLPRSEDPLS